KNGNRQPEPELPRSEMSMWPVTEVGVCKGGEYGSDRGQSESPNYRDHQNVDHVQRPERLPREFFEVDHRNGLDHNQRRGYHGAQPHRWSRRPHQQRYKARPQDAQAQTGIGDAVRETTT